MTNTILKNVSANTVTSLFPIIKKHYDSVLKKYAEVGVDKKMELWIDFPKTNFELLPTPIGGICLKAKDFIDNMQKISESESPLDGLQKLSRVLNVAVNDNGVSIVQTLGMEGLEILFQQFEILFKRCHFFFCNTEEIEVAAPVRDVRTGKPNSSRSNENDSNLKEPESSEKIESTPKYISENQKKIRIIAQNCIPDRDAFLSFEGSIQMIFFSFLVYLT